MDSYQGRKNDPLTLHKYAYGNLDPVNMVDPTGNFSLGSVMSAVSSVARLTTTAVTNVGRSLLSRVNFIAGRAPAANSIRWGFWRDLPKKVIGGRTYADIGGRAFTRHAVDHMAPRVFGTISGSQARGITPMMVGHVIRYGKLLGRYSRTINARGGTGYIRETYILDGLKVVTEANSRIVVSVVRLIW